MKNSTDTSWDRLLYSNYLNYLINGTILEKKKLLNTKCVFWFSLQLLSETFLILRGIKPDITINCTHVCTWSTCYSSHHVIEIEFSWQILKKSLNIRFHLKSPVEAELFHANGRTDRYDKVNSRFSQIVLDSLKIVSFLICQAYLMALRRGGGSSQTQ